MKWGVRKYQNPDGSLTEAGRKRYGYTDAHTGGSYNGKYESAGKMGRRFNRLEQVRANAIGESRLAANRAFRLGQKMNKRGDKVAAKGKDPMHDRKTMRLMRKARTAIDVANLRKSNAKEAELLQSRILNKAKNLGYTVSSKPVNRYAQTGRQRTMQLLFGAPGNAAWAVKNAKTMKVGSAQAKFRSYGDGSININRAPNDPNWMGKKKKEYARRYANG